MFEDWFAYNKLLQSLVVEYAFGKIVCNGI